MKRSIKMQAQISCALLFLGLLPLLAETNAPSPRLFTDLNLEKAVRRFVFEKRDNNKPLTEADVANLSTIESVGVGVTNLAGLEKCRSLASLDLSKNRIISLEPLRGLRNIQYLNLAGNRIRDTAPLSEIIALQYIELSNNQVTELRPLRPLTNLMSLYLSNNQITDFTPLLKLPRLATLYLDHNQLKSIEGINGLGRLFTLSLNHNQITDIAPLNGLSGLYFLGLENNKIRDLTPLVEMAKKDRDQSFAPFIRIFLRGNPLSSAAKRGQISTLRGIGSKVDY